jgi:glucose-6-phosphate-specific signal transduction histidine kinase
VPALDRDHQTIALFVEAHPRRATLARPVQRHILALLNPRYSHSDLSFSERRVTLLTENAVKGNPPNTGTGTGTGIAGMRQRVEALDGEFRAAPRPEGGFEVYARFPLGGHT